MSVAKTILEQLGGARFVMMTGSKNFVGSETNRTLSMKLTRNKLGASHLTITLTPADTYTMTFVRIRKFEKTELLNLTDVYFEQLPELFTKYTGLHTSL